MRVWIDQDSTDASDIVDAEIVPDQS